MTRSRIAILALLTAATACTAERSVTPDRSPLPVSASSVETITPQIPLLFVVDGRRYQRNELPLLTEDRIFAVRVIKGHAALEVYGRDGAYGVVVITTRTAVTPQA